MQRTGLPELPEISKDDMLFTLKELAYTPETPRKKQPFTVRGKIELFKIPFLAPIWVQVRVTYPRRWWEEIIPVIGSPTVAEGAMVIGGDFEIDFPWGFDREGEFQLEVNAYAGPTYSIDKITLPPFPPVASYETTFIVAGEVPPEEIGFRNFRISSYSKNGGTPVTPSGTLELEVGDKCRVNLGFDHKNGSVSGKIYAAIWKETLIDPHDEQLHADKVFSVPSSADWQPYEESVDIIITSAIKPGTEYGLYAKIVGITGGDIFTEYLGNVITILGAPPEKADIADFDFNATKGTYDIGAKVPFTASYKYKGAAQAGQLTISLGTGVYPSFFTQYTYSSRPIEFKAAVDWEEQGLEGNFTLPTNLEPGQAYSVRAKLETVDGVQETDTDWGVIIISEEVLPPPLPKADIADFRLNPTRGTYKIGDKVQFWADYKYKGKAQRGQLTISLGTGIYPSFFTKHTFSPVTVYFGERIDWTSGEIPGNFTLPTNLEPGQTYSVRAKLEALEDYAQETDTDWGVFTVEAAPPPSKYTVDGASVPGNGGYFYLEPYKDLYDRLDVVKITAFAYSGFAFDYWLINDRKVDYNPASVIVMDKDVWIECHFRSI